ncbi:hypothetical protein RHMOL_Rhmol04G0082300 [Rhododendron molle]|uniref:Uncharacterized protein n=1 Tax=Rhododendron molle TaxID=49168 RepID=A0ACC0NZJ1_RHOML|nr:hypothetical protein RHMOL_Rhmol04G0082300 [Rhododendron molle]
MCRGIEEEETQGRLRRLEVVKEAVPARPVPSPVACELCGSSASLFCQADNAFLCKKCDKWVHGANFLAQRHISSITLFQVILAGMVMVIVTVSQTIQKEDVIRYARFDHHYWVGKGRLRTKLIFGHINMKVVALDRVLTHDIKLNRLYFNPLKIDLLR